MAMGDSGESEELAKFREQWRAEVKQRAQTVSHNVQPPKPSSGAAHETQSPSPSTTKAAKVAVVAPAYVRAHHTQDSLHNSQSLSSALATYREAVQAEQRGQLDDALRLYRHAFRLDSNVDKAYHKEEIRLASVTAASTAVPSADNANVPKALSRRRRMSQESQTIEEGIRKLSVKTSPASKGAATETLAKLISSFPPDVAFFPEDENKDVPLSVLPDELLVHILKFLDIASIERFASISKKARILSLDSGLWRYFVKKTYIPPQIEVNESIEDLASNYLNDYRRFFIERPRLRLDGVYIAVCHYVRAGEHENPWVQISHLITYHRYLRFFPDGQVVSLLANDEVEPRTVIPLLRPTLRMKESVFRLLGLLVGTWSLEGTAVNVSNLIVPNDGQSRYSFQMALSLRSKPLGRWNRLDFLGYDSVDMESGEAIPLALKHERPFWFSKVRSYASA